MDRSSVAEVSLQKSTALKVQQSESPITYDTKNKMAYINLDSIRNSGAKTASSQVALGHVVAAINEGFQWVVVECGKPSKSKLSLGYTYSRQGQQVIDDAKDLASQASLYTVEERTAKNIKSTKTGGGTANEKPITVAFEVQST